MLVVKCLYVRVILSAILLQCYLIAWELKTAIQCLGIKPKAINKWLQYQGHWTQWHIKLDQQRRKVHGKSKKTKVINLQTSNSLITKTFALSIASQQLKTWLHGFDFVSVVVFSYFLSKNCFKGFENVCPSLRIHVFTLSFGKKLAIYS